MAPAALAASNALASTWGPKAITRTPVRARSSICSMAWGAARSTTASEAGSVADVATLRPLALTADSIRLLSSRLADTTRTPAPRWGGDRRRLGCAPREVGLPCFLSERLRGGGGQVEEVTGERRHCDRVPIRRPHARRRQNLSGKAHRLLEQFERSPPLFQIWRSQQLLERLAQPLFPFVE